MSAANRPVATVLLVWLAMIGVDLFLHAGVLAPLYDWDSAFLLDPVDAFLRIPAGYLAFGVLAVGLVWLLVRVRPATPGRAALLGGVGGGFIWAGLLAGLWSISTAPPILLLGWWAGQTLELAVGGYVAGRLLAGEPARSVAWMVAGIVVVGLVTAVALQSIGYAPAPVRLS